MVDTPQGFQPYVPTAPASTDRPLDTEGNPAKDNPDNPRGKPSLSLPQQATPLTSQQGVANPEDLADPVKAHARVAQDGQAEDDPMNPSGTPDYMVAPEDFQGPEAVDRREERRREEHREGVHGNQN